VVRHRRSLNAQQLRKLVPRARLGRQQSCHLQSSLVGESFEKAQSAADVLLQSIDLAVEAERLGMDEASNWPMA
jgi:hypothetical protein